MSRLDTPTGWARPGSPVSKDTGCRSGAGQGNLRSPAHFDAGSTGTGRTRRSSRKNCAAWGKGRVELIAAWLDRCSGQTHPFTPGGGTYAGTTRFRCCWTSIAITANRQSQTNFQESRRSGSTQKNEAWLPILHVTRGEWHFTALFSNTQTAHKLHRTRDWVVIYFLRPTPPRGSVHRSYRNRGRSGRKAGRPAAGKSNAVPAMLKQGSTFRHGE